MDLPIVVDDREKLPYEFSNRDIVKDRLNVGDYTLKGFENRFAVERKTFDDLATSVGSDRLRFENEIRRANGLAERNEAGNPLPGTKPPAPLDEFIVVVEASEDELYNFRNKSYCPNYYSKIHPNSVIGTVEGWPKKYDTLDFMWAGDRARSKLHTQQILDKWYIKYQQD